MPKITIIGAGSMVFAAQLIKDILLTPSLDSGIFALVDINAGANLDIDVTGTYDMNATTSGAVTVGTTWTQARSPVHSARPRG